MLYPPLIAFSPPAAWSDWHGGSGNHHRLLEDDALAAYNPLGQLCEPALLKICQNELLFKISQYELWLVGIV